MNKPIVSTIFAGVTTSLLAVAISFGCASGTKPSDRESAGGAGGAGPNDHNGNGPGTGSSPGVLSPDASAPEDDGSTEEAAAPTTDANCGSETSTTTRVVPDVLLLLDRSSSMYYTIDQDCFCSDADVTASGAMQGTLCDTAGSSGCQTRWSAVQPAVIDTVTNSQDINWGLKFLPTPDAPQCSVSRTMEVEMGANNADAVATQVQSVSLALSTPTAAALEAATAYLSTLDDDSPKFILLATDGEPNCAGGQIMNDDLPGAVTAAQAAYAAEIPVYVIGIGPNLENLTQIAAAGGTTDYYPVSSPQDLVAALAAIEQLVASCTFALGATPAGADINNLAVYLDKNLLPKDDPNGWTFDAGQASVVLQGAACDQLLAGQASTVDVYWGCGEEPPKQLTLLSRWPVNRLAAAGARGPRSVQPG
jgi:hypothetical protein